jgi:hypothetical protein
MADVAVNLQTPILKSTRDQLKELQEEHGHDTLGETIGWLIDEIDDCKALCSELQEEIGRTGE